MATTASATTAGYQLARDLKRIARGRSGNEGKALGPFLLKFAPAANIPTTNLDLADDLYILADFSDVANFFLTWLGVTLGDLDGAIGLVWDLVALDAAGAVDRVLINDSTVGRTAGSDELDANAGHQGYNLGGKRLAFRIVTAATTPAAGSVVLIVEGYADMETFT